MKGIYVGCLLELAVLAACGAVAVLCRAWR
jgi:hypothetical protein